MSSDNGYFSGNNIEAFVDENIDTYIATGKGEKIRVKMKKPEN